MNLVSIWPGSPQVSHIADPSSTQDAVIHEPSIWPGSPQVFHIADPSSTQDACHT